MVEVACGLDDDLESARDGLPVQAGRIFIMSWSTMSACILHLIRLAKLTLVFVKDASHDVKRLVSL